MTRRLGCPGHGKWGRARDMIWRKKNPSHYGGIEAYLYGTKGKPKRRCGKEKEVLGG